MPHIENVGKVTVSSGGAHWIIPNFYDLPQEYDTVISSPILSFANRTWYMNIYPNGNSYFSSCGWFGISISDMSVDCYFCTVRLGIIGDAQRNFVKLHADMDDDGWYRCMKLLTTSFLKSWRDIMVPGGNLHLFFNIEDSKHDSAVEAPFMQLVTGDEKWFKKKFENDYREASTQTEDEFVKEELKQYLYGESIEEPDQYEKHEDKFIEEFTTSEKDDGMEELCKDFKEMLLNGHISDVVLKVQGKKFKAHRCILAARSPVFLAMMTHETKEKMSGVVDIPDVDPETFADFLSYLYTGSVDNITSENVTKLYTIADKYQVDKLKSTCLDHMTMDVGIDNFCDVLTLSLRHDEKNLKETCIQFFAENSLDIILRSKWQTFLSENPIIGNELFIKHIQLNKKQ